MFFNGILRRFHVDFLAFPRDFGGVSRVCDDIFRAFCEKFSVFSVLFCCVFTRISLRFPGICESFQGRFQAISWHSVRGFEVF